jgi:tRNA (guanine-N7-)-methyltransferase
MAGSVGDGGAVMPKKKFYRQRAHANPFSDHQLDYPNNPTAMRWEEHFPSSSQPDGEGVEILDIGCGFGGLLVSLAPLFSDTSILGKCQCMPTIIEVYPLTGCTE